MSKNMEEFAARLEAKAEKWAKKLEEKAERFERRLERKRQRLDGEPGAELPQRSPRRRGAPRGIRFSMPGLIGVGTFLILFFGLHLVLPWSIVGGVGGLIFSQLLFSGNVRRTLALLIGGGLFLGLYFGAAVGLGPAIAGGVGGLIASNLIFRKPKHRRAPAIEMPPAPESVDGPAPKKATTPKASPTAANPEVEQATIKRDFLVEEAGRIKLEGMRSKVLALVEVIDRILEDLRAQPEHLPKARQFLNYYLDATVKIVKRYSELSRKGSKDKELADSLQRAEETIEALNEAFEKQLRILLESDKLDLDTEMTVLRRTIEAEGLGKGVGSP